MDANTAWAEFFQANSGYIIHLQQIAIILISAISIIFYNNRQLKKCSFIVISIIAFLFSIANIIVGFHLYSNLLETILSFAKKKTIPDLSGISNWIYVQFVLDVVIVVFIGIMACFVRIAKETSNESN